MLQCNTTKTGLYNSFTNATGPMVRLYPHRCVSVYALVGTPLTMELIYEILLFLPQPLTNATICEAVRNYRDPDTMHRYGPVEHWDTRLVTNMRRACSNTTFNEPIANWDVSNVTNMDCMFFLALSFNQPLNAWNVSSVTTMYKMFSGASTFNQYIGDWQVTNVRNMESMFDTAVQYNQRMEMWDMSNVSNISYMFTNAVRFNQPLNQWNLRSPQTTYRMFYHAMHYNQPFHKWPQHEGIILDHLDTHRHPFGVADCCSVCVVQ